MCRLKNSKTHAVILKSKKTAKWNGMGLPQGINLNVENLEAKTEQALKFNWTKKLYWETQKIIEIWAAKQNRKNSYHLDKSLNVVQHQ